MELELLTGWVGEGDTDMKIHKELDLGGFPSLSHRQVPACPAGNSSSPWWQGSPSTSQISGLQISQETGINSKRGDTREDPCLLWESQTLLSATSQLLGTFQAQPRGDEPPNFPP